MTNPTSNFALTLDSLASMFAASTNFQSWTNTANSTAARGHVYIGAILLPNNDTLTQLGIDPTDPIAGELYYASIRPYALLWLDFPQYNINTGAFGYGTVGCILEANISQANWYSNPDALYEFLNNAEPTLNDVFNAGYAPGNLLLRTMQPDGMPVRSAVEEGIDAGNGNTQTGFYFQWQLKFEYGAQPA